MTKITLTAGPVFSTASLTQVFSIHLQKYGLTIFLIRNKSQCCQAPVPISHCVRTVLKRDFSGPHFLVFGLNKDRIQSEYEKIRTEKTPLLDTFYVVPQ